MISETRLGEFEAALDELEFEHFDDQPLIQLAGDNADNFPSIKQLRYLIACARFVQALEPWDWDQVIFHLNHDVDGGWMLADALTNALKALRERE